MSVAQGARLSVSDPCPLFRAVWKGVHRGRGYNLNYKFWLKMALGVATQLVAMVSQFYKFS